MGLSTKLALRPNPWGLSAKLALRPIRGWPRTLNPIKCGTAAYNHSVQLVLNRLLSAGSALGQQQPNGVNDSGPCGETAQVLWSVFRKKKKTLEREDEP